MKEDATHDLSHVLKVVEIENIRLVRADVFSQIRTAQEASNAEVKLSWSSKIEKEEPGRFTVRAALQVRIHSEGRDEAVVRIDAEHEVNYRYPVDFSIKADQLEHFARVNAIYNAWPFWREFVQSMMLRQGLPPFVLPLMKVEPHAPVGANKADTGRKKGRRAARRS